MPKWLVWFANTHKHLMHVSSGWNTENHSKNKNKKTHPPESGGSKKTLLQFILSQRRNFYLVWTTIRLNILRHHWWFENLKQRNETKISKTSYSKTPIQQYNSQNDNVIITISKLASYVFFSVIVGCSHNNTWEFSMLTVTHTQIWMSL